MSRGRARPPRRGRLLRRHAGPDQRAPRPRGRQPPGRHSSHSSSARSRWSSLASQAAAFGGIAQRGDGPVVGARRWSPRCLLCHRRDPHRPYARRQRSHRRRHRPAGDRGARRSLRSAGHPQTAHRRAAHPRARTADRGRGAGRAAGERTPSGWPSMGRSASRPRGHAVWGRGARYGGGAEVPRRVGDIAVAVRAARRMTYGPAAARPARAPARRGCRSRAARPAGRPRAKRCQGEALHAHARARRRPSAAPAPRSPSGSPTSSNRPAAGRARSYTCRLAAACRASAASRVASRRRW